MRTWPSVFVCANLTFAVFDQAFICSTIRLRSSAGAVSRKLTLSFTPSALCQYLLVSTEIAVRRSDARGSNPIIRSTCGRLTGLISTAVFAASAQRFLGRDLGEHTILGFMVVPFRLTT